MERSQLKRIAFICTVRTQTGCRIDDLRKSVDDVIIRSYGHSRDAMSMADDAQDDVNRLTNE